MLYKLSLRALPAVLALSGLTGRTVVDVARCGLSNVPETIQWLMAMRMPPQDEGPAMVAEGQEITDDLRTKVQPQTRRRRMCPEPSGRFYPCSQHLVRSWWTA